MKNHNLPSLTREQLHREFAGTIQLSDFGTDFPNPCRRYAYTRKELQAQTLYFQKMRSLQLHHC